MKTYKIAVLGGDGTGPEVVREGVKVLKAIAPKEGFKVELADFDFGARDICARAKCCRPPR